MTLPDLPDLPDLPGLAFATLDTELPLALLPVRIEARFRPGELWLRFFPDTIHADGHADALTEAEQTLGRAFWVRSWRAGCPAGEDSAFAWLADQLGPWRAAWVAGRLAPVNPAAAPRAPVGDDSPLAPPPKLPKVATLAAAAPTQARLLPARFVVAGYVGGELVGTWWAAPIPAELGLAPRPVEADDGIDGRGLLVASGLEWTVDFEAAEQVGMALRIPLQDVDGFDELHAVGVRSGDQRAALEDLLSAHRYTHGLDFAAQGTPTNTTETAAAGTPLDLSALRAAELEHIAGPRPGIADEGDLYRMAAADAAAVALGLGRDTPLDRARLADLDELRRAEAMAQALWPAVGGHYLDALLAAPLGGDDRAWLRDWSSRFARGAAPLPALLVGRDPYGVLPVTQVVAPDYEPAGRIQQVQDILETLSGHWRDSVAAVPRLDPDATDAPQDGEADRVAVAAQVLGAVPHGTSFRLAHVDAMRATYASQLGGRLFVIGLLALTWPDARGVAYGDDPANRLYAQFVQFSADFDGARTIDEQVVFAGRFADVLDVFVASDDFTPAQQAVARQIRDENFQGPVMDFLEAHQARTFPLGWLALKVPGITRMIGDEDDPQAYFALRPTDVAFTLPLVAADRSEAELTWLRSWLSDVWQGVVTGFPAQHGYNEASPLLSQLLAWSAEQAIGTDDAESLAAGLAVLNEIARAPGDPVGELERLLREALGPWAYRLDAWYTAVAAWRLENKRAARARGIQVGAFGWLVDVKPRESARASQGYVLAPSLTHATTAAILRSGWSGMGEGMDVNLSSDRVRRARWITDGVRRGQDLGRLLGARFERGLHDARLDRWIDDFREIALAAVGSPAAPNAIVDGLLLARGRTGASDLTAEELDAGARIQALLDGDAADDAGGLETVLAGLLADLDAVADLAVAQSVFSLAQGNLPEATATLSAATTGATSFPPLRIADTAREAIGITHRLLLLLDPDASGSAWPSAASGRAAAAPALEAWLGGLLGDPAAYGFAVRFDDPETGAALAGPFSATLADIGLAALDAVFLAPAGEAADLGQLGALLSAWGEAKRPSPPAVLTLLPDRSLTDLAIAARSLRRLLSEARDLDDRDLSDPGATDATAGLDGFVGELAARIAAVRARLAAGRERLAAALPEPRQAMLSLAGFALPGAMPQAVDPDGAGRRGHRAARPDRRAPGRLRRARRVRGRGLGDARRDRPGGSPARPGDAADRSCDAPRPAFRGGRRCRAGLDVRPPAARLARGRHRLARRRRPGRSRGAAAAHRGRHGGSRARADAVRLLARAAARRRRRAVGRGRPAVARRAQPALPARHRRAAAVRRRAGGRARARRLERGAGQAAARRRPGLPLRRAERPPAAGDPAVRRRRRQRVRPRRRARHVAPDAASWPSSAWSARRRSPTSASTCRPRICPPTRIRARDLATARVRDRRARPVRGAGGSHRRPAVDARPPVAGGRVQGRGRRQPRTGRGHDRVRPVDTRAPGRARGRRPGDRAQPACWAGAGARARRRATHRGRAATGDRRRARAGADRPGGGPARRRGGAAAPPRTRRRRRAPGAGGEAARGVPASPPAGRRSRPGRPRAAGAAGAPGVRRAGAARTARARQSHPRREQPRARRLGNLVRRAVQRARGRRPRLEPAANGVSLPDRRRRVGAIRGPARRHRVRRRAARLARVRRARASRATWARGAR